MSSLGGRSTPTRTEKLSCPAIAGKGDHPAQQGGGRGAGLDATQVIQGKLGANAYCSATTPTRRVRRPLHHGSLAARAPVVPLPRYRGGGWCERSRSRDAPAPEFCRPKPRSFCLQKK